MKTSSEEIIKAVEDFIGYKIQWDARERDHSEPRQIVTYLIHKVCGLKPALVSKKIPVKRCMVYHSIKTVQELLMNKQFQIEKRSLFEKFGIEIVDYGF